MKPMSTKSLPPVKALWIGSKLNNIHLLSIASFLKNGHPYHLYAYDRPENIPSGVCNYSAAEILPKEEVFAYKTEPGLGSYSAVSNLFRYLLLVKTGGIWVDADVICLRPFLFNQEHYFAAQTLSTESARVATTCVMKAPVGSPIMQSCATEAALFDKETLQWAQAGPKLLQRVLKETGIKYTLAYSWEFCPVDWDEYQMIAKPEYSMLVPQAAYAIHLWHEMWRRQGEVLKTPRNSLYGSLIERYAPNLGFELFG